MARQKNGKSQRSSKRTIQDELEEIDSMDTYVREQVLSHNFKINCKFKNKKQKDMYDTILKNRITFVSGPAGTGKTLVSLMAGLECIKNPNINISQLVMVKPIVEITSQKGLGALPGGVEDKTFLYFTSFYDNLTKIIGNETTKYLKDNGVIKDTVLNYLRGSTFGKYTAEGKPIGSFCIFDETQNCTETEMKTFISRMGEETKLVIMGDIEQTDLKLGYNEISGLEDGLKRLRDIEGIGFVEFTEDDIVRDPFLIEIMKRYKKS
jgi:phosphate starvation-inducible protein PhoH and related proteins